jgi:hypothetical protein
MVGAPKTAPLQTVQWRQYRLQGGSDPRARRNVASPKEKHDLNSPDGHRDLELQPRSHPVGRGDRYRGIDRVGVARQHEIGPDT